VLKNHWCLFCATFHDYKAVYSKEKEKGRGKCHAGKSGNATSTMQVVDEGSWWVGCIQKMRRRASGSSRGSLKQPIDFANRKVNHGKKKTPISNVQVILHYYTCSPG